MSIPDPDISPKVSIIISTYNGEKFIAETIESIRAQTYQNWELIIMDDGSDDDTENIVKNISDERINFFKAGRIGRNGKIKNMALKKASGEMIAYIDHDDLWAPSKLEKQVTALQEYPEAGFSLTNGYNFKKVGVPLNIFYEQTEGERRGRFFLSVFQSPEIAIWTQALLMRKQCLATVGEFNEATFFSDPEFIITLSYHFDVIILNEPLVFHRIHDTNYSVVNWIRSQQEGIALVHHFKDRKMLPAPIARDALFRAHIHFGEKYLRFGKKANAIRQFRLAWGNKPLSVVPVKKIAKALLRSFKK